jgi:hypothetical protein
MPEEAAHELQRTVDEIVGYSRRTRKLVANIRKLVIALAVEAVLGVAVTVIVIILLISYRDQGTALRQQTFTVQQQATALHKSQLANCALSNETKAKELTLWHDLFTLSAQNNNASGQKVPASTTKFLEQFLGDVNTTYTPLDCAKIYRAG